MKLRQYLENLNRLAKESPDILDLELVYAGDEEGNDFHSLNYLPTLGVFEHGEFYSKNNLEDTDYTEDDINALCVN
jgi:hypothetical protein